jgi:nicotinamide N-methyltransferase
VVSDYPAAVVLANLRVNVAKNIPSAVRESVDRVRIEGHTWGDLSTPFALAHQHHFTRILAADCLWMPHEHENLVKSLLHFLSLDRAARVYVVAGFHTGRARLAEFFETTARLGLEAEDLYEEDVAGVRREWVTEQDDGRENVTERKRWLVVSRLKRKE